MTEQQQTTYLIFRYQDSGMVAELGEETVPARSRASTAIEKFLNGLAGGIGGDEGIYVAVRKDEWRPERASVQTQTTIVLTPVSDD